MKNKMCESCGSMEYPYHKEYCDMGIVADWIVENDK